MCVCVRVVAQSKLVIEKKKKNGKRKKKREKRYQIKLTTKKKTFHRVLQNREILARQKHVDTEKDLSQAVKRVCMFCMYVCNDFAPPPPKVRIEEE